MNAVTNFAVGAIKIHPRNTDFFDDIQGEEYDRFKKSIACEGIITPLVASPDMTLLSGHQRLKAATDLGITEIPVIIMEGMIDEDNKLKVLLASNFGRLKNNPMKQSRVISEYEKLCGVKRGGDRGNQYTKKVADQNNLGLPTQEDIAKQLGVTTETLRNLKNLQKLSPELQDLVESGELKATTACKVWAKLTTDQQQEFLNKLGIDVVKSLSGEETKSEIERLIEERDDAKNKYRKEYEARQVLKTEKEQLKKQIEELEDRDVISETVEVAPEDYEEMKSIIEQLKQANNKIKTDKERLEEKLSNVMELSKETQRELIVLQKAESARKFVEENQVTPPASVVLDYTPALLLKACSEFDKLSNPFMFEGIHIDRMNEIEKKTCIEEMNQVVSNIEIIIKNLKGESYYE